MQILIWFRTLAVRAWGGIWRSRPAPAAIAIVPMPATIDPPPPKPQPVKPKPVEDDRSDDVEEAGRWFFKGDILDRLDSYMKSIRQMRRYDPDAYDLYSKVGAVIVNPNFVTNATSADGVSLSEGLAFGAVAFLFESRETTIGAKFVYFQKLNHTDGVARHWTSRPWLERGDVYRVTTFFWGGKRHKLGLPASFYLFVDKDRGDTRVLPEKMRVDQHIDQRRACVTHYRWDYPIFLKERGDPPVACDPQENGREIFMLAYNTYANASMDVRVACTKGDATAAFAVDLLRMPYFFADRDRDKESRRKKIFHIVRTHRRKDGFVKSHFRGQRQFIWNGYDVRISMPGKHHSDLLTARFSGEEYDGETVPKGLLTTADMGARLQRHLQA